MNRNILTGIIITSLLTALFLLIFYFFKINTKALHAINVLPRNTVFALEVKNVSLQYKLLNQQLFWQQLCNNPAIAKANNNIKFLDSLLNNQIDFEDWKESENTVISFHAYSNSTVDELLMVETIKKIDIEDLVVWISSNNKDRLNTTKRNFVGNIIYDFVDFKAQRSFSIAYKNKLFIISSNGQLVEEAILNAGAQKAYESSALDKLSYVKSLGAYNLYVNYRNLPLFIGNYIDMEKAINLKPLSMMADWAALGINTTNSSLHLKGVSITNDSLFQYFDCFNNLQSTEQSIKKILPTNTTYYFGINYSDEKTFEQNLAEYFKVNRIDATNVVRDSIDKLARYFNLKKSLQLSLGNEVAQIGLHNPQLSIDSCQLLIVKLKNKELLINEFKYLTAADSLNNGDTLLQNMPNVFSIGLQNYFDFKWGNIFMRNNANYALIYNDYLILGNNLITLNDFYQQQVQTKLLANNSDFTNQQLGINQSNNIEFIINNSLAMQQVEQVLQPAFSNDYLSNKVYFKKAQFVVFQMAATTDKNYATNLYVNFNMQINNKTELLWDLELDTSIATQPQVVLHSATNQNAIFVQDAKNQVYLINNESKIIFKTAVIGRILGGVNQVDAFKNGKVQYLFNTSSQVYLLDENGKNLQGYPFWIPTGTNHPVKVFDHFNDKTYQIYAVGKYYKIWVYNIQTRLQSGWNPKNYWPNPIQNVQAFSFRNELVSYLIDEKGQLNFFQLNGKTYNVFGFDSLNKYQYITHEKIDSTHFNFYFIDSTNAFKVKYYDASAGMGKTNIIKSIKTLPIGTSVVNNELYFIQKQSGVLSVISSKGTVIYSKALLDTFDYKMQLLYNNKGLQFAYIDSIAGKVFLENESNKPMSDFPLKANLYYQFGNLMNDDRNYLITSDMENKLLVYQIK
jgi:hypothetical protein